MAAGTKVTFSQRDTASNVTTNGAQSEELRVRVLVQMRLKRRHWTGRLDVGGSLFSRILEVIVPPIGYRKRAA